MPNLCDVPGWYLILALIIASYQGYRGFMFQWLLAPEATFSESQEEKDRKATVNQPKWTRKQKVLLLCIADTILYSISALFGFFSLFLSYHVLNHVLSLANISAGLSALLIFLIVFGVLGVCGQLPYLIQQGKLLWKP